MPLRFGILGTGNIARQFVSSLKTSERCVATAVGSRRPDGADAFASQWCPAAARCGYDDLLARPDVDAIYVSLPNVFHKEWTLRALRAGKHVLCEKPLAMNAPQAEEMFAEARRAGRLLVEAFMYVSHPQTLEYMSAVRNGQIGTLRHIRPNFCFRVNKSVGNIRFDPALGGGALMDVGCYCVNFARMVANAEPEHVAASGVMHASGVDEQVAALLRFPGGLTATFVAGMTLQLDNTATISGTDGYIEVPWPWKPQSTGAKWAIARTAPPRQEGGTGRDFPPRQEFLVGGPTKDLYAYEADDFAAAVAGEKPPAVTEANSIGNMRVIDHIRKAMGA
jgi:predicted dehydrogenase